MPLRNKMLGVYYILNVGGLYIIVNTANRDRKEDAKAKNFVQGTPKARILDIGGISEDISISAPILVGGAAGNDGRALISLFLTEAINPTSTTVPVLENATISITEAGSNVSIRMKSDGRPSSHSFEISSFPIDDILDGSGHGILDPINGSPSRVARFFDFRAKIGKIVYWIMECNVQINLQIITKYFIAGNDNDYTGPLPSTVPGGNPLASTDVNNPYNFGTQFPFLGVAGITVQGSGKAAVDLTNSTGTDYDFQEYNGAMNQWDAVNVDLTLDGSNYELTNQLPGQVITAADLQGNTTHGFQLQIYNHALSQWDDLIDNTILDLSKAVVNQANFMVSTGVLENNFAFVCWVK